MGDQYPPDHGPVEAAQQRLERSTQVENARDTQFQGFAMLLWYELIAANGMGYIDVNAGDDGIDPTNYRQILARRAYDLVKYTLGNIAPIDLDRLSLDEQVARIPDMTE